LFNLKKVQWAIEIGNVADQSYTGVKYNKTSQPILYLGPGDYSNIFDSDE